MNLSLSKSFYQQWRPVDKEDAWESANGVPNVGGNSLYGSDNDNVLLLIFEVLGSEWKDEVHNGTVDAANHDVVLQLLQQVLFAHLHLSLWLRMAFVVSVDLCFNVNFRTCLFVGVSNSERAIGLVCVFF